MWGGFQPYEGYNFKYGGFIDKIQCVRKKEVWLSGKEILKPN
jgi:hypothetical protein